MLFNKYKELLKSQVDEPLNAAEYTGEKSPGYVILNLRATITPQDGLLEGTAFRFGIEYAFDMNYMPALATRPAPGRNLKFTVSKAF